MVTLTSFLPDKGTMDALARLSGPVAVFRPKRLIGGLTQLSLRARNEIGVKLAVDYNDVTFKFELFNLVAREESALQEDQITRVATIFEWDVISCLFRFEWQRPALPGEISPGSTPTRRGRGQRRDVPPTANALGVSMVGIAFWSCRSDSAVAAIVSDDDNVPCALRLCQEPQEIQEAMSGTERVYLDEVANWIGRLGSV